LRSLFACHQVPSTTTSVTGQSGAESSRFSAFSPGKSKMGGAFGFERAASSAVSVEKSNPTWRLALGKPRSRSRTVPMRTLLSRGCWRSTTRVFVARGLTKAHKHSGLGRSHVSHRARGTKSSGASTGGSSGPGNMGRLLSTASTDGSLGSTVRGTCLSEAWRFASLAQRR